MESDLLPSFFSLQFFSFLFLGHSITEGRSITQTGLTDCNQSAPSAQSCIRVGFRWSALLQAIWLAHGERQGMWRLCLSLMSSMSNWKTGNATVSKDANISPKKQDKNVVASTIQKFQHWNLIVKKLWDFYVVTFNIQNVHNNTGSLSQNTAQQLKDSGN